jgi:uncharacterized membrane protein YfcA
MVRALLAAAGSDRRGGRYRPSRRHVRDRRGAVIVRVLFEIFRLFGVPDAVRMQLCIGTSLAIILPTAWRSYRAHHARGMVIPEVLRIWTVPVIVGVVLGAVIAAFAPSAIFKVAFVLISALIITQMLFVSDNAADY